MLPGGKNIVKMTILPNAIYRFNVKVEQNSELEQKIHNSYGNTKGPK